MSDPVVRATQLPFTSAPTSIFVLFNQNGVSKLGQADPANVAGSTGATKSYVDSQDASTLAAAKAYADAQDVAKVSKTGDTMTGPLVFAQATLTGASSPSLNDAQTWNNAATTFTGWKLNVTNTAANSNSNLINLQVGGEDRFNFTIGGVGRLVRHTMDDSGMTVFLRKKGNAGNVDGGIASDGVIGGFSFSGFDNVSAFFTGAIIQVLAEEAWTATKGGSRMLFQVTTPGTQTGVNVLLLKSTMALLPLGISLGIQSGANQRAGELTLTGTTPVVIPNTTVTAKTQVILTRRTKNGTTGDVTYSTIAATSFTVVSSVVTDLGVINYFLIEVP